MFAFTPRSEVWIRNLKRSEQLGKNLDNPNENEESNDAGVEGSDDPRSEGRKFRSHN